MIIRGEKMNTLQKILTATTMASALGIQAQQIEIKPMTTSLECSILNGESRTRLSTGAIFDANNFKIQLHGMNEASPGYFSGRETLVLSEKSNPISLVYATKIFGTIDNIRRLDAAVGMRTKISGNIYGFVDVVQHYGISKTKGTEIVSFVGKDFGKSILEGSIMADKSGITYLESQITVPVNDSRTSKTSGFVRAEYIPSNNTKNIILGIQLLYK